MSAKDKNVKTADQDGSVDLGQKRTGNGARDLEISVVSIYWRMLDFRLMKLNRM